MRAITAVVEGTSDEGVVRALLHHCGLELGILLGGKGKGYIRKNIENYNKAARSMPWFVLVDLDNPDDCPTQIVRDWLPSRSSLLLLRIAVVEAESWMLADRERMADFLAVSPAKLPHNPDEIRNPKQFVVNLARNSRKRDVREAMVPRPGSGTPVGPNYASDVRDFGETMWRPAVAAEHSPSLARCIRRLQELAT